ncbi:MAG: hypothetical protein HUJ51_00355, partial [Eggerthellaceae bacterium]|nr:hypothetical protein [Eggerthellaceae bacterium]
MNFNMDYYRENIGRFVKYLTNRAKPHDSYVGIELEYTIVDPANKAPVFYEPEDGRPGINSLLEILSKSYSSRIYDQKNELIGLARKSDRGYIESITLEPAGNFELSAGPFISLDDANNSFQKFEANISALLGTMGYELLAAGINPFANAEDMPLIPKQRYNFMDRYFKKIGPWGKKMMRVTGSTQISIDYKNAQDCIRKMQLGYIIAPLCYLICDNSVVTNKEIYPAHCARMKIWESLDPERCGTIPNILDKDFSLKSYAEYIMNVPAIVNYLGEGKVAYSEKTFKEIYANKLMHTADIEHAISMIFPDVRARGYIELRATDALPAEYAISYAALIKGIFTNDSTIHNVEAKINVVNEQEICLAKQQIMLEGFNAEVYSKNAGELCEELFAIAEEGLNKDSKICQSEMQNFLNKRSKGGQFDDLLGSKFFQIIGETGSSQLSVQEFINFFLQFEEDLKRNSDLFERKLTEEREIYSNLEEQCRRYKSEKLNSEGFCQNAKIYGEITDVDIQRKLEGIKEIIITVIYNQYVEEIHFEIGGVNSNAVLHKKFEFKPTSRNDHFEFIMKGINERDQVFDIGSKVFDLNEVKSQDEYSVQIIIPEIDDENSVAAYI